LFLLVFAEGTVAFCSQSKITSATKLIGKIEIIDPAQKICIVLSHPRDKNKDVARVGHPDGVAILKDRINTMRLP